MKSRNMERILVVWTALVAIANFIYVPFLIMTTSGGEQSPLTFIALSVIVWVFIGGVITIAFRITEKKKESR